MVPRRGVLDGEQQTEFRDRIGAFVSFYVFNDSWIAATAMALGVAVVTQDQGFPALDEPRVVRA